MENESANFFIKNIDYIKNIISILIGSGIGYITTTQIERRKEKRNQNLKKLNSILIPLSEYMENSINIFKNRDFNDKNFSYIKSETKKFLKVQNKIYYTTTIRKSLNEFYEDFNDFKKSYDADLRNINENFHKYINSILYNHISTSIQTIEYYNSSKIKNLIFKEESINEKDFLNLLKNDATLESYDKDTGLFNSQREVNEEEIDIFSGPENDEWDTNNILLFIFENSSLDKLEEIIHNKSTLRKQFKHILLELNFLNAFIIKEILKIIE